MHAAEGGKGGSQGKEHNGEELRVGRSKRYTQLQCQRAFFCVPKSSLLGR